MSIAEENDLTPAQRQMLEDRRRSSEAALHVARNPRIQAQLARDRSKDRVVTRQDLIERHFGGVDPLAAG
ncbi:MAG: hypothetical protein JWO77_3723 [Ilumatobacteraceae bacterium]|nr:hypothetical protein [Ilumatobacteraceae bacterium]